MSQNTTATNQHTITIEKFHEIVSILASRPLLTPKEANQLTYHITELLMVNNCESRLLRLLSRYLSQKAYEDIIEERIIEHYCGYPLCTYKDSNKIKDLEINKLVQSLRMPRSYNSKFCCKNHYLCSEFYKNQLGKDALFMRINLNKPWFSDGSVENEIILLDEYINMKEAGSETSDLSNVIEMLRGLNVTDNDTKVKTNELIEKIENFQVIEHSGAHQSDYVYE